MTQLPFHNYSIGTPPTLPESQLPVLRKLVVAYKLWHGILGHLPRLSRFTIGAKIDSLYTDVIGDLHLTGFARRNEKPSLLQRASIRLDTLKFYIQIAWEVKAIDHKKYIMLVEPLVEIGKMIGGWIRQLEKQAPA